MPMPCPQCDSVKPRCVDSRPSDDGTMRRRRYRCSRGHLFSTYETYTTSPVWQTEGIMEKMQQIFGPLADVMSLAQQLPKVTKHNIRPPSMQIGQQEEGRNE